MGADVPWLCNLVQLRYQSREENDVLSREPLKVYHAWADGGQVANISRIS
jgi:hypothetical protein